MSINGINRMVSVVEAAQKIVRQKVSRNQPSAENYNGDCSKINEGKFAANYIKHALISKLDASRVKRPNPEQIARRYAPILVLPQGKYNLPADPNSFIANSRLREDRTFRKDKEHGHNYNGNPRDNFSAADVGRVTDDDYFLDLNNSRRGTLGSRDAPIFYQFEERTKKHPPRMTYFFFYPYNDAPKANPYVKAVGPLGVLAGEIDLNHEGDWERVTLELDPNTYKPVNALYSAHTGNSDVSYKRVEKDAATNRPLVFVATGSHANYTKPGRHALHHGIAHDPTVVDRNRDRKIDRRDGAVFFDTARDLREVTSQSWYPKTGEGLHWGEIGEIKDTSGPFGPSQKKGAVG
jgi:hypothetical protein